MGGGAGLYLDQEVVQGVEVDVAVIHEIPKPLGLRLMMMAGLRQLTRGKSSLQGMESLLKAVLYGLHEAPVEGAQLGFGWRGALNRGQDEQAPVALVDLTMEEEGAGARAGLSALTRGLGISEQCCLATRHGGLEGEGLRLLKADAELGQLV